MRRSSVAAIGCLLALRAVAQEPVEFLFAGQQCFHYDTPIAANATLEICGPLPQGETVLWKFNAGADLALTLNAQGGTPAIRSHPASRGERGQFVAPADGRYCWTWRNTGAQPVPFAMEMEHP